MQCKQPPQYSLAYFNKNKNLNETDISLFCLNGIDLDIRRYFELMDSPGSFPGEVTQLPDLCLRLKAVHLALKTNQSLLKMPPSWRSTARRGGGVSKLQWSNRPHIEVMPYEEKRLQNQSWMLLIPSRRGCPAWKCWAPKHLWLMFRLYARHRSKAEGQP